MNNNVFALWINSAGITEWLTNISAFLAVFLLALVIIGFRRYIKRPRTAPIDFICTGIWALSLTAILRFVWWDLLPDFLGFTWQDSGYEMPDFNWIFNLMTCASALYMLRGYYLLVEERAPGRYNILTAVFYPRRLRLWISARGEGE